MARVSIKDYATTRSVSEDRIRSLLVGFNPNVRKNGDEYTVDSDTLDKLFRLEEEAKRASSLRSELDKASAKLAQDDQSNIHAGISTWAAAASAIAACFAAGLSTCSTMVASDQLKSTLAATDAKNRYEVQILVANKINDIASRVLELADRQGDKTSANKEIGNMLLGLDETFVIADDLHREGGFVSGWGEFIKRNCDRLQRNGYYKGVGTAEPLSKTKGICEAYLEK